MNEPEPAKSNTITIYRGYEIRWAFDCHRAPTHYWLPTIIHPTDRARSMSCATLRGCKNKIDGMHAGLLEKW